MREVVNAILYECKNGCGWRDLPGDFKPNWHTVYPYFNAWGTDGTLERIYEALHRRWREEQGRKETPSAAVIDSQSVQAGGAGGERGYDGGKGVTGRKRHLMVDTEGMPMAVEVTAANVGDREGAKCLLLQGQAKLPRLAHLWVDGGYDGAPFSDWAEKRASGLSKWFGKRPTARSKFCRAGGWWSARLRGSTNVVGSAATSSIASRASSGLFTWQCFGYLCGGLLPHQQLHR